MALSSTALELLRNFEAGLSDSFRLEWQGDVPQLNNRHPLALEIAALRAGYPSSLPYTRQGRTNWVTFGGDLQNLNAAIEDIRAWLIPNLAWELAPPFVTAGKAEGKLGKLLAQFSPAGYYRWACHSREALTAAQRLRQGRQIIGDRPRTVTERTPT